MHKKESQSNSPAAGVMVRASARLLLWMVMHSLVTSSPAWVRSSSWLVWVPYSSRLGMVFSRPSGM
jgi:hypothetical protein